MIGVEVEDREEVGVELVELTEEAEPQVALLRPWPLYVADFLSGWGWGMVTPLRFYFLVVILQVPLPAAGLIEGVALGWPRIVRVVANRLPDAFSLRLSALNGYFIQNAGRVMLAFTLSGSWPYALSAVLLEGTGRGLIEAAREVAENEDNTSPIHWWGALGGKLGAISAAVALFYMDPRWALMLSAAPSALAVFTVPLWKLRRRPGTDLARERLRRGNLGRYGARFWLFTGASAALWLGNISVAFFLLRLASFEQPLYMLAFAFALYVGVYTLVSLLARRLRARWGNLPALLTGYAALLVATLVWIPIAEAWQGWVLLVVAGGTTSLISGAGREMVAIYVEGKDVEGARKAYYAMTGAAALVGNLLAGVFWVLGGPGTAFGYAAWGLGLALALMVAWLPWLRRGFG